MTAETLGQIAVTANGLTVFIPSGAPDLSARRLELEMMTEYDPETYPLLWDALAADYEQVYGEDSIIAKKCRQKAAYYGGTEAY